MSNELPRFGISLSAKQGREMLRKGSAMEADGCYMVVVALTEMDRSERYLDVNCGSIVAFGHQFAGLSRSDVYAKLACGRALSHLHKVDDNFRRGLLCWTKVRAICRVATEETEDQWLEKARVLSSSQLEHEVAADREPITPRGKVPLKAIDRRIYLKLQDVMALMRNRAGNPHLSDEDCLEATLDFFLTTEQPTDLTDPTSVTYVTPRVTCVTPPETSQARWQRARTQLAAHPHNHDDDSPTLSRHIPDQTNQHVRRRAAYACEAPDCESDLALEAHHIVFFKDHPDHSADNIILLCNPCHKALHHTIHLQHHPL